MQTLAQRVSALDALRSVVTACAYTSLRQITGICVSLGEYPKVRYYKPRAPFHEASVLCGHLARFVQEELDEYAKWNPNFPPPSSRPQGVLVITDRSMDLMAPLVHEFTYQAMAHDLLPIKDGDKVTFHMTINEGTPGQEEKDMELHDKDKVWVDNRHRHMKDTIDKLMDDFNKFINQNPNFTANEGQNTTSLNAIKDMLAGLPQFQEMKEAYSLHLTMAQEAMNVFEKHKLPDIASVEQTLATGVDEDFKKPKNILEQVVRLLDDEAISPADRLRLIMTYVLYRGGTIPEDIRRLLGHASLPPSDGEAINNLELLGGRTLKALKDPRTPPQPVFPQEKRNSVVNEEYALSRFEPVLKRVLGDLSRGALDTAVFPYVKPPMDPNEDAASMQGSLRTAAPRWAGAGRRVVENRQRIIVFVAGGATYSETRTCYEASASRGKDVFLATSHMLTPALFLRQVRDLSVDKRRLDLPQERPKPKPPAHLFERPAPPPQPRQQQMQQPGGAPGRRPVAPPAGGMLPSGPRPPTAAMGNMSLGPAGGASQQPPANGSGFDGAPPPGAQHAGPRKLEKEKDKDKEHKKKRFFGIKK